MGTCKMWPKSIPSFHHMLVTCSFRSRQLGRLFFPTQVTCLFFFQTKVIKSLVSLSHKQFVCFSFRHRQLNPWFSYTQVTWSFVLSHGLSSLPNTDHYLDSHSNNWVKNRLTFVQPPYQNRKSICIHHLQRQWSWLSVKYQIQHLNAPHADKYISLHQQK